MVVIVDSITEEEIKVPNREVIEEEIKTLNREVEDSIEILKVDPNHKVEVIKNLNQEEEEVEEDFRDFQGSD